MQKVVLFYNGLDVPTRQILDSRGIIPSKTADGCKRKKNTNFDQDNANPSYQEQRQSMEETLRKFMGESAKIHEENSNLIKEIRASTDSTIKNQGASIKTLEIQIGQMSKVLQERGFGSLPSSTETNPRDHVKLISTIVEVDVTSIRRIGSHQYVVSTRQNITLMYETKQTTILFPSHLNNCYYEDKKGSYGPQFLEAYSYGASHIDKSIPRKEKDLGSFTLPCYINNVYFENSQANIRMLAFALGNIQKELLKCASRRDQVDDLMPTIEEGKVIKEFRARNDARMVSKNFGYPSDCDHDKKIHIDCAHNLKFSYMIDFAVLEDIDAYHDEGIGNLIFGELFLREVEINVKWFKGMITIYNGNEKVTYQMVWSHLRFKHHTNEQCNKISPLIKNYGSHRANIACSMRRVSKEAEGRSLLIDELKEKVFPGDKHIVIYSLSSLSAPETNTAYRSIHTVYRQFASPNPIAFVHFDDLCNLS
ncbi:hypothetical protein Tco_0115702 [Tanacetum coccineum]